ncbi:hypothetical protein BVX93_01370 [bacterium B13(2017)]|nr:hypothetical protein BVX93_01370 [bacterium B13(2017)]
MNIQIDEVLKGLLNKNGSDLHLKVGLKPIMRIKGDLEIQEELSPISQEDMEIIVDKILAQSQKQIFNTNHEVDTSYEIPDVARFRGNIFLQKGKYGAVFRIIPNIIPTIEEMNYPPIIKDFTEKEQGLILVTGPTGSGKSTTLAAMINHINENEKVHIITIEDPIEFVHKDKKAVVNQREIGFDTLSFANALRAALRQDPDIILVGEMRDAITIQIAMAAAETGHLVFSTLHTIDAKQTIDRIIDTFDPLQQHQIRMQLANVLQAVISQKLIPKADNSGRIAAQEIMINSPMIKKLIEENKSGAIQKAMDESSSFYGMQTFNQHLFNLVKQNVITEEIALSSSMNSADLKIKLQTSSFKSDVKNQSGIVGPQKFF